MTLSDTRACEATQAGGTAMRFGVVPLGFRGWHG
jgi:hypothetical protein